MPRLAAILIFLSVAAPATADSAAGRYSFMPAENGVFRLDAETGDVSLCLSRNASLVCLRVPANPAPRAAPGADDRRIDTLEKRLSALESRTTAAREPPRGEAMGRVRILAARIMDRVVALVRSWKSERETGAL